MTVTQMTVITLMTVITFLPGVCVALCCVVLLVAIVTFYTGTPKWRQSPLFYLDSVCASLFFVAICIFFCLRDENENEGKSPFYLVYVSSRDLCCVCTEYRKRFFYVLETKMKTKANRRFSVGVSVGVWVYVCVWVWVWVWVCWCVWVCVFVGVCCVCMFFFFFSCVYPNTIFYLSARQ